MGENDYNPAKRVKCPLCEQEFENEKAGEPMPTKDVTKQAHFKGLEHFGEEHQDWMSENTGFPGLIPVEKKPRKLETLSENS